MDVRYEAGNFSGTGFGASSSLSDSDGTFTSRFLEIWCHENCGEAWKVRLCCDSLQVAFSSEVDWVLFRFSRESESFKFEQK